MKRGLGNEEQVNLVLDSLKYTINRDEHHSLESLDEKTIIEYEKVRTIDKIRALESESMNNTMARHQSYGDLNDIHFGYIDGKKLECFHVTDFEREESRRRLFKPHERVIRDKKIVIVFAYPLSKLVRVNLENKKGFSRMDLFKAIYKGYKQIYDEEEAEVGDPGHWKYAMNRATSHGKYGIWNHYIGDLVIERVLYSPSKRTVELFIGS